jgi:hypothetical protein
VAKWTTEHNALLNDRRTELHAEGVTVYTEDQSSFRIKGKTGIVVTCELEGDTTLLEYQTDEFSVMPVPASAIKTIEHFDFTGLSQNEKTMHLLDLFAVVHRDYDRYTRDKYGLLAIELDKAIKQIPATNPVAVDTRSSIFSMGRPIVTIPGQQSAGRDSFWTI